MTSEFNLIIVECFSTRKIFSFVPKSSYLVARMRTIKALVTNPTATFVRRNANSTPYIKWDSEFQLYSAKSLVSQNTGSRFRVCCSARRSSPVVTSGLGSGLLHGSRERVEKVEERVEKVIYGCRFFAILAVWGSLVGSFLCFIKGCTCVAASFQDYFVNRGKVIFSLVEALDVYLLGTVMLVFGMGLYELFISNLDKPKSSSDERMPYRSNFFGFFTLKERPRWLEIKSVNELKTKLGHVIVMLLLIGFFDKTKKAAILSPTDLLCFSASVFLSSGCLFLLSKLHTSDA